NARILDVAGRCALKMLRCLVQIPLLQRCIAQPSIRGLIVRLPSHDLPKRSDASFAMVPRVIVEIRQEALELELAERARSKLDLIAPGRSRCFKVGCTPAAEIISDVLFQFVRFHAETLADRI